MFKSVSLRLKLVLAFMFVAALLVTVCVYQLNSMQQFNKQLDEITTQGLARLSVIQNISTTSIQLSDHQTDYQNAVSISSPVVAREKQALLTQTNTLEQQLQQYETLSKQNSANLPTWRTVIESGNQLVTQHRAAATLTTPIGTVGQTELTESQSQLNKAISSVASAEQRNIQAKATNTTKQNMDNQFITGVMVIIFVMIAGIVGIITASRIGRSIAMLGAGAERIANGDFSQELNTSSRDEIGQVGMIFNRMAQRLRESYRRIALEQQRDEAILKGMGEGIIATDEQGRIVIINQVAADLLELGNETNVLNKPIQEAYPLYSINDGKDAKLKPEDRPSFKALTTGHPVEDVFGFHTKNGIKRQINIAASPFMLEEKVVGVVTILRDVTKEKEIDRMKTEFISLASHQLRTPLSAIKWFSEMLINGDAGKLKAEQMDFMNNISESTERMIALVTSLLNISRIESGRIMIVPEPTDLSELVSGIVNDLKAKTEEKQQTLIISVHEELPKINLDPRLVGQVYLNLLTNAIKYTPKGGEISVFISKKDDMIISQVTDNGYGIPKEQQSRMFEKFFRAANAVKIETDGTGLGLYLIKAIIESSGGKIWFKSEENKGTTFWFSIPMSGMKAKEGEVTLES